MTAQVVSFMPAGSHGMTGAVMSSSSAQFVRINHIDQHVALGVKARIICGTDYLLTLLPPAPAAMSGPAAAGKCIFNYWLRLLVKMRA
jgi:hypothetical protein